MGFRNLGLKELSFLSYAILLLFFWAACGDDSSSEITPPKKDSEPGSSTSWADGELKDSSAIGDEFLSGMGNTSVIKGEVVDSALDITYSTIQFGAYIWMAENAVVETGDSYSYCYNQDVSRCKSFGRLYKPYGAEKACPAGFGLPSKADFEYLSGFAGNLYGSDFGFNLKMGGMCVDSLDNLRCTNADKMAYLLTKSTDILQVARGGKISYGVRNSDAFYSVRCRKFNYFVDSRKFLPICNLSTERELGDFYVAEEGFNYRCNGQSWVRRDTRSCYSADSGKKFYYKDSLFVCDSIWKLAAMDNSMEVCNDSLQWEERRLNGVSYICEDSTWRTLTAIEDSLGVCTPQKKGTSDSVSMGSFYSLYRCDSSGWQEVSLSEILGTCEESKLYQKASYRGDTFVCRSDKKWTTLSSVEKEVGICTKELQGKLDSIEGTSYGYLVCDSLSWRRASFDEVFGKCNSEKHFEMVYYEGDTLVCRRTDKWEKASVQERLAGVCTSKRQNEIDSLASGAYICDTLTWRPTVVSDYIGKCNVQNLYKVVSFQDSTYGCDKSFKWKTLTGIVAQLGYCTPEIKFKVMTYNNKRYICDSTSAWRVASSQETMGPCYSDREGDTLTLGYTHYVCSANRWREMSSLEYSMKNPCLRSMEDSVVTYVGSQYICKKEAWKSYSIVDAHDSCTTKRLDEIVVFQDKKYVCGKSGWVVYNSLNDKLGYCGVNDYGQAVLDDNETIYYCSYGTWETTTNVAEILGRNCLSGTTDTLITSVYYCSGNKWFPYTSVEDRLGFCSVYNMKQVQSIGDSNYVCMLMDRDTYGWRLLDKMDTALGVCDGTKMLWKRYEGVDYSCGFNVKNRQGWITSKVNFDAMYTTCFMNEKMYGMTVGYNGKLYYCHVDLNSIADTYSGWHEMTPIDDVDGVCTREREGDLIQYNSHTYVCRKDSYYHWSVKPDAVPNSEE